MANKKIRCRGHEPIFIQPDYRQGWADVWIDFKTRPRKRHYFAPTLVSAGSVRGEIEMDIWGLSYYAKEAENWNERRGEWMKDTTAEDMVEHCRKSKAENELLLQQILDAGLLIEPNERDAGLPTIYTSNDYIDRNEAERMLRHFLQTIGHKHVSFRWQRPPKGRDGKILIATPIG